MRTASYAIPELRTRQQDSSNAWLEFLNVPSLSMGVYNIPAGTDDRETHAPHDRDEVYLGISGKGRLTADDKEFDVEPGAIVYVKAGVEHHFHDVSDDLTVLVFFSSADRDDG